jgi:hypothetical protein
MMGTPLLDDADEEEDAALESPLPPVPDPPIPASLARVNSCNSPMIWQLIVLEMNIPAKPVRHVEFRIR